MTKLLILLAVSAVSLLAQGSSTLHSQHADGDLELTTDPDSPAWTSAPSVVTTSSPRGMYIAANSLEVRSRWNNDALYFLLICHYDEMHLRPISDRKSETPRLYDFDIAQVFLAPDKSPGNRYFEFEVSPRGEFADAAYEPGKVNADAFAWDSGFKVAAKLDGPRKIWYAAIRIPWRAISPAGPPAGTASRANFCRMQGNPRVRSYLSWMKTGTDSVHKVDAFGKVVLDE